MRFCMITTYYPPFNFGGDGTYVEALSRNLVLRGHEVTVVHCIDAYRLKVSSGSIPETQVEIRDGITVHRLSSPLRALSPLLTQQLGRPCLKRSKIERILADRYDVVHFHNVSLIGGPGLISMAPPDSLKIYTTHEHWLLCPTHIFWKNRSTACDARTCFSCCLRSGIPPQLWRYTRFLSNALEHLDLMLSPSEYTAEQHRRLDVGVPIVVHPLFSRLEPDTRNYPAREPPRYFLYVGRIEASKGLDPLLEQFEDSPHEIRIAGDGPLLGKLQQRYGNHENVRFYGRVDAAGLKRLYANATALILPSLAPESFGLTAVEAMAFATPAIVRDAGGAAESVVATGAGRVFRDFGELPGLLDELSLPNVAASLRARAQIGYEQHYTPDIHLDRYLDFIGQAMGSSTRCAR